MRPERLAEIDALFAQALELSGEARAAFIAERAGGDPELRLELEALLERAEHSVGGLLEPVRAFAERVTAQPADELAPGELVGAYRLVRRLGEGGMGVVHLAERVDGFEQQVALKLLPGSLPRGREAIQRFEQERQILARLQHPGIAHLIDGGVDRRGLPYLVMEHIDGVAIDRWCDERRATVAARISLVIEVAAAVQAAHRNLVVHRDLKPSNVMVDDSGRVKLLDFGIAKLLDDSDAALTVTQARALTPTYASPEQVSGGAITTAADVYQLGLLLYELVTGHRPQEGRSSSLAELVERVCRREPPPPSRAVLEDFGGRSAEDLAALRRSTPARLARAFRPELDAVVAGALAKDPERRHPSASALADDLQRFLEGRPVHARRPSLAFRLRRWVGRNAALAATGLIALLALAGYAVTVTFQARAIDRQRARAEAEAATATAVERFLVQLFAVSDPDASGNPNVTARELLERGAARVGEELADQPEVQARLWSVLGQIQDSLGAGDEARRLLARALELQEGERGDTLDGAESHRRLGVALRRRGERREAERHLDIAVERLRRLGGPDDPRLALALADLGLTKAFRGEFAGAAADLAASLDIRRRNGSRAEIAETQGFIGLLEVLRGEAETAERHYRQALEGFRSLYGERHVKVAWAITLVAEARRLQGDLEGALAAFNQGLAIHRALLGDRHVEVGEDLSGIALIHLQLDRLAEADALYAESLAILRPQLTADHPELLAAQQGLGALRVLQGRFAEGEELLAGVAAGWLEKPRPASLKARRAFLWLGRSLEKQGRRAEAIAAWQQGLAVEPGLVDDLAEKMRTELAAANAAPEPKER